MNKGLPIMNDAKMVKLNKTPFTFLEGPIWCKRRKMLFFSDPLDQAIIAMDKLGNFKKISSNSGYVNGMCINNEGNLVVCKMETGSLEEIDPDNGKTLRVISAGYRGKPFNATNDVICDNKGGYYVTDPFFTYGPRTQDIEATYYVKPDGQTLRVATESIKPNGLALSVDGSKLYIDDTGSTKVWCYDVNDDGMLSNPTVFCNIQPPPDISALPPVQHFGEADGMKIDSQGNVYVTTFNGIQVFDASGNYLGTIKMPGEETPANLAFGDDNLDTIFITARTSLYCMKTNIPGI
ncbi:MAG: SMP-30/gluconolactonase/LRE family protein [Bacillota bacterium]